MTTLIYQQAAAEAKRRHLADAERRRREREQMFTPINETEFMRGREEGLFCPRCGSDEVENDSIPNEEESRLYQDRVCRACWLSWADRYHLSGIAHESAQDAGNTVEVIEAKPEIIVTVRRGMVESVTFSPSILLPLYVQVIDEDIDGPERRIFDNYNGEDEQGRPFDSQD